MTISTTTAKSRYAGDGSTTAFPTGFTFLSNDQVRVILRRSDGSEALWTEGSEYSLTGAGVPGGGTVEVATSPVDHTPVAGETLVVKLAVVPRQDTSLPLGGAFPSTAVEAMADLAALRDQQIEEALSRAVKFNETTALADVGMPEPLAGKPIGWNAAGDALVNLEAIGRWQGDWQTGTGYVALDLVRDPTTQNVYVCDLAHTSGTFASDLAAGRWSLAIDVEAAALAVTAAEAAQAAAELAQGSAQTAGAAAAAAATAAATSEANAGTSATAAAADAAAASAAASGAQTAQVDAQAAASAAGVARLAAQTARSEAEAAQTAAEAAAVNAGGSADAAAASAAAAGALYQDLEAVQAAASAAQSAAGDAETAEANAETAEANAGAAATAAAGAASAAALSESNAQSYAAGALAQAVAAAGSASAAAGHASGASDAAAAAAASAAQVEAAKLVWRGDWNGGVAYAVNDAVAHAGASWICVEAHGDQAPPNAASWDLLATRGAQGIQGEQGLQGLPGDDGIGVVPQGAWSAGTDYGINDGVTHQGSYWRSRQDANQGNAPDSAPSHWDLIVAKGDQGEQGMPGVDGDLSAGGNVGGDLNMQDNQIVRANMQDYSIHNSAGSGTNGAISFDYSVGPDFDLQLSGNVSGITITNWPQSGPLGKVTIQFRQPSNGTYTVSFSGIDFGDTDAPEMPSGTGALLEVVLWSRDSGSTVYGAAVFMKAGS